MQRESMWKRIRNQIAQDIAQGTLAVGSMLPTEHALSENFGVNRHTVRRALKALADDGLIRAEQGRGTFVQDIGVDYLIGRRTRFSENVMGQDREPGLEVLSDDIIQADERVAHALKIPMGATCVVTHTRRLADDRPISVATSYFPWDLLPNFGEALRAHRSVTLALKAMGIDDYERVFTRISARLPSQQDADLLKQPKNRPVLHVHAINAALDGRRIEFGQTRFASDRVNLTIDPDGKQPFS